MEWSDENVIKLIDAYRKNTLIWNPQHENHFKKHLKADAWREISVEMDLTVDQCKKKIISLLSSYRREKSKIKSSLGTGKGRDEVYVSRWFAYEHFKFLEDRDVPRKGLTTETDVIFEVEIEDDTGFNNSEKRQEEATASTSTGRPAKRVKRADSVDSSMMTTAFSILKNAAEKMTKPQSKVNEVDAFFTYVAAKVHKYSPQTQEAVQHAVFELSVKADKGFFDWENSPENIPFPQQHYVLQPVHTASNVIPEPPSVSAQISPSPSVISEPFSDYV